jgi:hypothetical protein
MVDTAIVPRRLWFRDSDFPMSLLDLAGLIMGLIATVAGLILLLLGASDVAGSALIGLGVGLIPVAVYTAHERRDQDVQYQAQVGRLAQLDFVVDPPRMAQVVNAANMGKSMFAQSGPNVSQTRMDEYMKQTRLHALALGGSVPTVLECMLNDGLWPRCLFKADGSPAEDQNHIAVSKIEDAITASVDYVASRAFRIGWQVQFALSLASVRKHDQSARMQALTGVIFDTKIAEYLQVVGRGSTLGQTVSALTTEVIHRARVGRVTIDDFISFLTFLHWFTASLSRAYPWDPRYAAAIVRADKLLEQIRNPASSPETTAVFTDLASVLAL